VTIELRSVVKRFGSFSALRDVSLLVEQGELLALLGPSGSGKTTLLRVIAGLDVPDSGEVLFGGEDATLRSVRERNVGFVFQHYALFRHMSVFENIAFGLRVRPRRTRPTEADIRRRVGELLDLVQLDQMATRYPSQLSGGQRQRVALARALAVEPQVLLLDEPFGALDAKVRKELRRWLRRLHDELHVTSVFVTHDQEEALELADRVVIVNQGIIEQIGRPEDVYARPRSAFVYDFLGDVNVFKGRVERGRIRLGDVTFDVPGLPPTAARDASVYVRPHLLELRKQPDGRLPGFGARVLRVNPAGPLVRVELETSWGEPVRVELAQERYRALDIQPDQHLFVAVHPTDLFVSPETWTPSDRLAPLGAVSAAAVPA
jgi:sulfate transport system ATP-binding protein